MKKCKYCGTTENLRTDSHGRIYTECTCCILKNQIKLKECLESYLYNLNYNISSKQDLLTFLKLHENFFYTLKGALIKSLYIKIDYYNHGDFDIISCINSINNNFKLQLKSSNLEILYCINNNILSTPIDSLGYEMRFDKKAYCYVINSFNSARKEWIKHNKLNQNRKGELLSITKLKDDLIHKGYVFYKDNILYSKSGFYNAFYLSPVYKKYRYSIWYYTNFLNIETDINERIFCLYSNITSLPVCPICKMSSLNFISLQKGYRLYCSTSCQQNDPIQKKAKEDTMMKKYGCKSGFHMMHKYGLSCTTEAIEKRKETINNWSDATLLAYKNKVSQGLLNVYKERGDQINKQRYTTMANNNNFNKNIGFFDLKGQELFWDLHDHSKQKAIYATVNTRDITNTQNDEIFINVSKISRTSFARRLDFYIKFQNENELCIEFDPCFHSKNLKKDILRENEILTIRPNMIMLRITEDIYIKNKKKVKKDLLTIINLMDKGIFNWGYIPDYLKPLTQQKYNNNRILS